MGSSGPFVVKPYSLVLTDIKQTAGVIAIGDETKN